MGKFDECTQPICEMTSFTFTQLLCVEETVLNCYSVTFLWYQNKAAQCFENVVKLNAFHVAGECRRQVIHLTNFVKNVNIAEFHGHIWNHHDKCIQQGTNMPGIGSLIREIDINISEILESKHNLCSVLKTNTRLNLRQLRQMMTLN